MATHLKPQGCTNLKLRQLGRMVTRHYDRYLAEAGLKNTQYALLSQMDASTLTRNLQPMAAQGWLTIGQGEDGRSRLIAATREGLEMRAKGQRAWKEAQLALNGLLGVERVFALHALLDSSIASLDQGND
ncbi:MAG: MarR family transcriptional regulator [Betaproteobacteria bacterium]|nr:MarR family transcriptional regulator [Betaproteobacteria bacterium]